MALIKLKRNWFDPSGQRRKARDGLHQIPDDWIGQVPSDATVFDDNGKPLPSAAPVPRPGHGAKPLEEQVLDQLPGGGPTHMISTATSADITTVPDEDLEKEVKRRQEEREKLAAEQAKTPEHKEEQKVVDKNLAELAKLTPPVEVTPAKVVTPPKPATPPATK
jgi:hypothetical protein